MTLIVGVMTCLVMVVLAVGPPGIRKFVFVGFTIFSLTFLYFFDKSNKDLEASRVLLLAKENQAATVIKLEELQLESVKLVNISYGAYEFEGIVSNKSKYVLSGMSFRVVLTDCVGSGLPDSCSVVGERDALVTLAVPPGETHPFRGSPITFTNLPMSSQSRRASFELIGARAEL